eukprot:gene37139-45819_t
MSHFLDRLTYFSQPRETFAQGHGETNGEDRTWEDAYRDRWAHDKIVRSTHGVNCTGSCSWKIYVKGGIVTWETQQTDYPRTRPDLPNHEPRGCPRGASYSWYVYSAQRVKYPMVRGRLMEMWREARVTMDPVTAWEYISQDPVRAASYKTVRGQGGFVRATWDDANEMMAAANAYTIKKFGPAGKKTAVVSTINGDANVPFYKELGNQGIKAKDIPVVAFSVGEEELAGIDTKPLVGHLAAWNYFQSVKDPANAEFIKTWQAFTKNAKRVTNDPMEASVIGFNMWVEA